MPAIISAIASMARSCGRKDDQAQMIRQSHITDRHTGLRSGIQIRTDTFVMDKGIDHISIQPRKPDLDSGLRRNDGRGLEG